jgi:hypothetical protein
VTFSYRTGQNDEETQSACSSFSGDQNDKITPSVKLCTTEGSSDPTKISPLAWIALVAETHRHNLIFATYLVVLTLMLIGLALVIRKTFARRSYIYLDLATETVIAQIRFCALPDATRKFSVKVSKRPTVLECRSFCLFGVISLQS